MKPIALLGSLLLSACATVPPAPPPVGVEAAVAFDLHGERGAVAHGYADRANHRLATPDDPVRVASVSKLGVALGVMRLVETGVLDLDAPVDRWLGWPLRNPAFPDRPISLRQLLSHTGSVRDQGDSYVLPLDGSVRAMMADPKSWDPAHGPGDNVFAYANINFPITAGVMERATGERFDRLMARLVIAPLGLDACYNTLACSDAAVARIVELDFADGKPRKDDLHGHRPACPVSPASDGSCDLTRWRAGDNGAMFAPQGGLRISPRGLAVIGRMLLGNGMIDGRRFLTPASVDTMLATQWTFDGHNGASELGFYCRYGLATQALATPVAGCHDDPLPRSGAWVGHAGEAYGLRSGLWIDRARGVGIAYYATGLPDQPPPGKSAFYAAEERAFTTAVELLDGRH